VFSALQTAKFPQVREDFLSPKASDSPEFKNPFLRLSEGPEPAASPEPVEGSKDVPLRGHSLFGVALSHRAPVVAFPHH
jgi:hypothetical protein